jgi:hypothetical protein
MQQEQSNLGPRIPGRRLRAEDADQRLRHFLEERRRLNQSIRDTISLGADIDDANLKSNGFVADACSGDSAYVDRTPEHAGFLHRLTDALHHSRRLQAAVVIGRYRHLIDPACGYQPTKGVQQMSVNEPPRPATKAWFSFGAKILIAAVVIGLGVLHIVGDAVLRGHPVAAKADTAALNKYGD